MVETLLFLADISQKLDWMLLLNLFTDQFQQMKRMKRGFRAPGLPLDITTVLHFNMLQPIAGHVQRKAKHLSQNAVPTLRLGHPNFFGGGYL